MHRRFFLPLLAASVAFLFGCDLEEWGNTTRHKEDFHQSHPFKSGGRIYLESFNGSVEITGWDQETADISGTKYASTQEALDALKVDIIASGDSIRIRTVRPSLRRGNMGASFVIKVPRRTSLDRIESSNGAVRVTDIEGNARLKTSNGGVRVASLRGDLEAETSNGRVEVQDTTGKMVLHSSNGSIHAGEVRGAFSASTSNGGIRASLTDLEPNRLIKASSSNGSIDLTFAELKGNTIEASTSNSSITLRLPGSISAQVKAYTSNSSVTSEFDMTVKGSIGKSHLEGTIGSGGPLIDARTSNGSIKLLKNTI